MENKIYSIFYSWQSDINASRKSIDKKLSAIEKEFKNKNEIEIIIDKATRDTEGSIPISDTLIEKICKADFFVCDISIIHEKNVMPRRTPNPNVLIELGYAVACLGWDRVIMFVGNKVDIDDLPFDIKHRRIFKVDDQLSINTIYNSFLKTISEGTPKPFLGQLEIEKVKRDSEVLDSLFQTFEKKDFDSWLKSDNSNVSEEILSYQYCLDEFYQSSDYGLYDEKLKGITDEFKKVVDSLLLPIREVYEGTSEIYGSYDGLSDKDGIIIKREKISEFREKKKEVKNVLDKLLSYIRENYPTIKLTKKSKDKPWLKSLPNWLELTLNKLG